MLMLSSANFFQNKLFQKTFLEHYLCSVNLTVLNQILMNPRKCPNTTEFFFDQDHQSEINTMLKDLNIQTLNKISSFEL